MQDTTEERKINGKKIAIIVCVCIAAVFLLAKVVVPNYKYRAALNAYMALDGYTRAEKVDSERELLKCARVGDSVYFGSYWQTGKKEDMEAIEWRVLAKEDNKILVISQYILEEEPYDEQKSENVTWETCTLRGWLNSTFFHIAFCADERSMILSSKVTADKNPDYDDIDPGNDTTDKVFLLSISETEKYFYWAYKRKCDMTDHVCAQQFYYYKINGHPYGTWVLRTPGVYSCASVSTDGLINSSGRYDLYASSGIRPAMWISLDD